MMLQYTIYIYTITVEYRISIFDIHVLKIIHPQYQFEDLAPSSDVNMSC